MRGSKDTKGNLEKWAIYLGPVFPRASVDFGRSNWKADHSSIDIPQGAWKLRSGFIKGDFFIKHSCFELRLQRITT